MTAAIATLPSGPLDLLVRAALAPEAAARAAWQEWRRGYALDETPWNEVRLLGAVADRIAWLEPTADISPRMKGIQKFLYAQSQICLTGCMSGVAALSAAGIPVMAIKGAARVMADGRIARERLVRDLDVLVPLPQAAQAYDCLVAAGWSLKESGPWQNFWRQLNPVANHHAWSLAKDK
ncbi:MAG: nucleotidyltransferase family protein, partial [Aestuariivirga sp.]|nr:nucleotidyltransferase family protein [Aestuariivirga sp.]